MSTKISALPASAGLVLTDIFPVVDDPGGVPVTQKATFSQLQTLLSAGMVASFNARVGAVTLLLADVTALVDSRYVLKAGDTMTGLLTVTTAASSINAVTSDAGTTNSPITLEIFHRTSGVAAAGFGNRLQFSADTNGGTNQPQARIDTIWNDAANATRTSQLSFGTRNSAAISTELILSLGQTQVRTQNAAAPGLTFQGDLDTGLFSLVANTLNITAGGTSVAAFTSTTGIVFSTSFALPYVAKTATYTASAVDYTIDCTANTFTVNLPTAVGITGRIYVVKNSGVGTITVDPSGAELIDGAATATVVAGASATIQSTNAGWIII